MLGRIVLLLLLAVGLMGQAKFALFQVGSIFTNGNSPIGTNLGGAAGYSGEWPFINAFKMGGGWNTYTSNAGGETSEEAYEYANCMDSNGYPTHVGLGCPQSTFTASASGSTSMVVTALGTGPGPWLNGTISGTGVSGAPTIIACPGGVCGGTGTYTLCGVPQGCAASQTFSTTITEQATYRVSRATVGLAPATGGVQSPFYIGGASSWLLIYDGDENPAAGGSSNFTFGGDVATLVGHSCAAGTCTDTLTVNPSAAGMQINLAVTDPNSNGHYVKNIRLVRPSQLTAYNAGQIFNPDFLNEIKQFRLIRPMQWLQIIFSPVGTWSLRTLLSNAMWADPTVGGGAPPIEALINLANTTHENLYLNTPCLADITYVTNEAALVFANLNSNLSVIKEYCNEPWNEVSGAGPASVTTAMKANGLALFPGCGAGSANCLYRWVAYMTAQTKAIYGAVFTGGNAARFVNVANDQYECTGCFGAQMATWLATDQGGSASYWAGQWNTQIDAWAIAPYFNVMADPPLAWTADGDGGVAKLKQQMLTGDLIPLAPSASTTGSTTTFNLANIYATTSLVDSTCAVWRANHSSASATNVFTLSGTPSHNLALGASTTTTIVSGDVYTTCYDLASTTWKIVFHEPQGDCGNGPGVSCTPVSSTHFTATSGQSLADPPPNGTCVLLSPNVTGSGTSNDLAMDGGAPRPIKGADGVAIQWQSGAGFFYDICLTSQTSAGAVTPYWETDGSGNLCGPEVKCINGYVAGNKVTPDLYSKLFYAYEGGLNPVNTCKTGDPPHCGNNGVANPYVDTLYTSFFTSQASKDVLAQALANYKTGGLINFTNFTDGSGNWGGLYFSWSPGTYSSFGVTARQQALYDYINATPCWWSGCTIH